MLTGQVLFSKLSLYFLLASPRDILFCVSKNSLRDGRAASPADSGVTFPDNQR